MNLCQLAQLKLIQAHLPATPTPSLHSINMSGEHVILLSGKNYLRQRCREGSSGKFHYRGEILTGRWICVKHTRAVWISFGWCYKNSPEQCLLECRLGARELCGLGRQTLVPKVNADDKIHVIIPAPLLIAGFMSLS